MFSLKKRLQQILIEDQWIAQPDLDQALAKQKRTGGSLSEILVQMKLITLEVLNLAVNEGLSLPPVDLSRLTIEPEAIKAIPSEIALNYQVLPISLKENQLTLAMADPLNIFALDEMETLRSLTITPILARPQDITKKIEVFYSSNSSGQIEKLMKDIQSGEAMDLLEDVDVHENDKIEKLTEEAPIIKLTDAIIKQSVTAKASDVFIEPMEKTMRIRYRVDGVIREVDQMSKALHFSVISRIKVISNLDISEHRLPQDGRFRTLIDGDRQVDFRVSVLPTAFGEKIVLRVLDKNSDVLDIVKLGFEKESLERLKKASLNPHGMILTCGPTGSGKTTTLYSILKFIDSPEKNMITVEDPVEYQMKGINQVNVQPRVGLTFSSSLRSILRQDPDVILIGEIRDSETLDIAVKAALTGHLVLSSLHTTTAAGSVIRMVNMGVEPFLLCSSVLGIIAQRLLRKLCVHCKEAYEVPKELLNKLNLKKIAQQHSLQFFRAKGCKKCFNTGYSGRVGITEILILTPKIKDLILSRVGEHQIKEAGRQEGMVTMRADGLQKAVQGLTSLEEVLRITAPDEEIEE